MMNISCQKLRKTSISYKSKFWCLIVLNTIYIIHNWNDKKCLHIPPLRFFTIQLLDNVEPCFLASYWDSLRIVFHPYGSRSYSANYVHSFYLINNVQHLARPGLVVIRSFDPQFADFWQNMIFPTEIFKWL